MVLLSLTFWFFPTAGHSRTIVGVEQLKGDAEPRLIMFDPSHSPAQMSQLSYTQMAVEAMRLLRKNLNSMKARQYQMVVVVGLMETEHEFKVSKMSFSRIPMFHNV